MPDTELKRVRRQLGYKADAVINMLITRAEQLNEPVMSPASLKTKLSEWENGRSAVSGHYQRLFRDIYGRTNEELGFPPEQHNDEASELRERLQVARGLDAATVAAFRRQVDAMRFPDRKLGGMTLLDGLRGDIARMQGLFDFSTSHGQRAALAGVITEASTLAGWLSLDRNAVTQAWAHYERAKVAARESGSVGLFAHALAEQAVILLDLGETEAAVAQLSQANDHAADRTSPLLRAWLSAALGEGLAAAGDHANSLRAFDRADALLPDDPRDPDLPFVFLGDSHLDSWRGNALAKLGDANAIDQLSDALTRLPDSFVRARVRILVDLAYAYAAIGDRSATLYYSRKARTVGTQIKTDRQLSRLAALSLPA